MKHYRHLLLIISLLALVLAGCGEQAASPSATTESVPSSPASIEATGVVVPEKWTVISFSVGGRVVDLPVSAGDEVFRNRALARLDNEDASRAVSIAEAQVSQAEVNVKVAEHELDRVVTWSPNKNSLAAAEAALANAEASLKQAQYQYDRVHRIKRIAPICT